ncbi:mannose-6-phosphate isomerase, class I [Cellulomonas sp. APG4]|uniref:mannose-6-phosphate isomerase, class I n=1 Tax=Cellulomonas sp. APG4 TaxID=1538656 RepID=UPI00192A6CA7|nr:mannose-6-phosphate isomerase, class I [Cellulomonas sp. APG4]
MFRLDSPVQHYAWGSTTQLPELLGVEPDGRPFAELWMGAHPAAPSSALLADPEGDVRRVRLDEVIDRTPDELLGERVREAHGTQLPYLLKVLAVERPLSLQVHPDLEHARAGFAREQAAGIPLDSPLRSFKDAEHKPELVVALTRFDALSGFRRPERVLELLDGLDTPLTARLRAMLTAEPDADGVRRAFESLLAPAPADEVVATAAACDARLRAGSHCPRADGTVVGLAQWYPGDPGAIASLFLNRVTLEPGEAMFVPAGSVHAYLAGSALEIMACSDNVLRAGLTGKHVDVAALLECTVYEPGPTLRPEPDRPDPTTAVYRGPAREFALGVTTVRRSAGTVALPGDGPRIVLCLEGRVELEADGGSLTLTRGQAALVAAADGPAQVRGAGTLATAFTPVPTASAPVPDVVRVSSSSTPLPAPSATGLTAAAPGNTSQR